MGFVGPDAFGTSPAFLHGWYGLLVARLGMELPDDIDPELWFWSEQCGGRDYLFDAHWHTHPGRMMAFCPHQGQDYNISKSELPAEVPDATRFWVAGFLAGNLPARPFDVDDPRGPAMTEWRRAAERFATEGVWHVEADLSEPWTRVKQDCVEDSIVLAAIGRTIENQVSPLTVTVPADLAAKAREATRRRSYTFANNEVDLSMHYAAVLSHIGMELAGDGARSEDGSRVRLDPRLVGSALNASDEYWTQPDARDNPEPTEPA